jgi:hypothetical protein
MNIGVLLLFCTEGRGTSFTRDWADSAMGRVAQYYAAQSSGQQTIGYKVYEWIQLDKTEQEWADLGFGAYAALRPFIEGKIKESLDPFDRILIGIDHSKSSGGVTFGTTTHLAASNFTPSLISHELGHRFGAPDAFLETPTGNQVYLDQFCVMGTTGGFTDSSIPDPTGAMLNQSGPGMSSPTLMAVGWLKENEHGSGVDLSGNSVFSSSGALVQLSALTGAPAPTRSGPPLIARYNDLIIEYRLRSGWDEGIGETGASARGWLVVHRSDRNAPSTVLVDSIPAKPGNVLTLGKDNPVDIFSPGPLTIHVISFDANNKTVNFQLKRRAARRTVPQGTIYGGVDVGGGGLVWTPGRGFTKVPPHSPVINVLEQAARIQELQDMMAVASRTELSALESEAASARRELQGMAQGLHIAPSISPLEQALTNISTMSENNGHFSEAAHRQLNDVKQILSEAVEEERQA